MNHSDASEVIDTPATRNEAEQLVVDLQKRAEVCAKREQELIRELNVVRRLRAMTTAALDADQQKAKADADMPDQGY